MKTNISQALRKAFSFQKSGALTQAIEQYKGILHTNSTCVEANFELANCFTITKEYNNALLYFKKAIKLDSKCYLARFNMAKIYEKLCKYEFSIFHLEKTIEISPNFYEALFSMAQCYRKMKDEKNMIIYLKKTLEKKTDHPGANHLLTSLNEETTSEYSREYARDLFDRYANHFEEHLVESLQYKVPFIIKEKLHSLNLLKTSKVLDLGCGTGLLGKTIVDLFSNLTGVDISSNMIAETRKKGIYSQLHISDIHDFLINNNEEFNLIIAADVFIYIGEIERIFSYVKESISTDGYFIFTIELLDKINKENYQLAKSGRFSHRMDYIEFLCLEVGFEIIEKEEIILREEDKIGQKGAMFILKPDGFDKSPSF